MECVPVSASQSCVSWQQLPQLFTLTSSTHSTSAYLCEHLGRSRWKYQRGDTASLVFPLGLHPLLKIRLFFPRLLSLQKKLKLNRRQNAVLFFFKKKNSFTFSAVNVFFAIVALIEFFADISTENAQYSYLCQGSVSAANAPRWPLFLCCH